MSLEAFQQAAAAGGIKAKFCLPGVGPLQTFCKVGTTSALYEFCCKAIKGDCSLEALCSSGVQGFFEGATAGTFKFISQKMTARKVLKAPGFEKIHSGAKSPYEILERRDIPTTLSQEERAAFDAVELEMKYKPGGVSAESTVNEATRSSIKNIIKSKNLPTKGKIRYIPPENWNPSEPLPRQGRGFVDKLGNVWEKGPSRTAGQAKEWDVQLSNKGKSQLGWATRDNEHLNVSLDGEITHK